jgi:Uma2 family endonuclease
MAPAASWHNDNADNIKDIFRHFIKQNNLPYKVYSDSLRVHYSCSKHHTPDIAVVKDPSVVVKDDIYVAPDLIVEILSPSTGKADLTEKKDHYGELGVPEYWTVNVKDKSITMWENKSGTALEITSFYQLPDEKYFEPCETLPETTFHTALFGSALTVDLEDVFYGL